MKMMHAVNHKLFISIVLSLVIVLVTLGGTYVFEAAGEIYNGRKITAVLKNVSEDNSVDAEKLILPLLNQRYLSVRQKADLYENLGYYYYQKSRMTDYLNIIGDILFYTQEAEMPEKAILNYSLLAQYYLEAGADKSGYETILNARRIMNFYRISDPVIRSQALHSYGRFLLYESDFEDALKAEGVMEEDALLIAKYDPSFGRHSLRRALGFKAYIMMMQGKTEESYALAEKLYSEYFDENEEFNHAGIYDFLLPLFRIKTMWALRNSNYAKALEFNREYGKITRKYDFLMKKIDLSREVLFSLPDSMNEERKQLMWEVGQDSEKLSQKFLNEYTGIAGQKLTSTMQNLQYENVRARMKKRIFQLILLFIGILLVLVLIIDVIYSETQIDGLTKLRNRRALNIRLGHLASSGKRYSAIMIDIDDFKKLNDSFGHDFGDEVLRGIAQLLLMNERHNIKCYRYGGEEMVIILEHIDLEHAVKFSERIRTEISLLRWRENVRVTASFGLGYEMPDSVKEADENMYLAKKKGKNFTAYRKDGKQYLAERRMDIRNPVPDKF